MAFIEKKGVNLQTRFLGYARKEIKHLGEFIQTLQVNKKRFFTRAMLLVILKALVIIQGCKRS